MSLNPPAAIRVLPFLLALAAPNAWADTTPDQFNFTDVTGAQPDTTVESDPITITGIDAPANISITGGQYKIDGGSFTSSSGTVSNGASVIVRATSSSSFNSPVDATLTVDTISDTFTVTTRAANTDTIDDKNGDPVTISSSAGTVMNFARVTPEPSGKGTTYNYDNGFFSYNITGLSSGANVTVTMTLPSGGNTPSYYVKCVASGTSCGTLNSAYVNIAGNVVTLSLKDGAQGDSDGAANGTIADPGAPAYTASLGGTGGYGTTSGYDGGAVDLWALVALLTAAFLVPFLRPRKAFASNRSIDSDPIDF